MLRGRCECRAVAYEVADAFDTAWNCHCSNCRAMSGSAFVPCGEIAREKLRLLAEPDAVVQVDRAYHCATCLSLLFWTVRDGTRARVPYGALVDPPSLLPQAHIFVGSKAPWYEIRDDLPQYDERAGGATS